MMHFGNGDKPNARNRANYYSQVYFCICDYYFVPVKYTAQFFSCHLCVIMEWSSVLTVTVQLACVLCIVNRSFMILFVKLIARTPMHLDAARKIRSHAAVFCDKRTYSTSGRVLNWCIFSCYSISASKISSVKFGCLYFMLFIGICQHWRFYTYQ